MRSDDRAHRVLFRQGISGQNASGPLLRYGNRKGSDLLDQQLPVAVTHHRKTLQMPLAGGTLLQMDQAASSDHTLFRDFRECREDADMDCGVGVRAGRDHEEAPEPGPESLHNFTGLERDRFRENARFTSLGGGQLQTGRKRLAQPIEFIRLTVGR